MAIVNIVITMFTNVINYFPNKMDKKNIVIDVVVVVVVPNQIPQTLLLETGLLACVVVVIVAQLTPQIVASLYPVRLKRGFLKHSSLYNG